MGVIGELRLYDWDMDDIKRKMKNSSFLEVQQMYIEKNQEYGKKCSYYLTATGQEKTDIEKECELLYRQLLVISLHITNRLTENKSIYI